MGASIRDSIIYFSRGDSLHLYWKLFRIAERTNNRVSRDILVFALARLARRHGGYIGHGAKIDGELRLPHGLHGIYISRYSRIGANCRIYQNVTIGETAGRAPSIGNDCLIGAGAILIGGIKVGNRVKIGAGVVLSCDVPDDSTVLASAPRVISRSAKDAA